MPAIYPFTAIVGQERMKRALVLNAVDPRIGGVLIRGERGTAKSTAARALAALLPHVRVVQDCRFGCDPDRPTTWCTECKERAASNGDKLPVTSRDLLSIAALTASLNVDGHRADLVILKAARAQAAFEGRKRINDHDIALAAELALPHRIKRTPFQQAEMTTEQLQERIEQLAGQAVQTETDESQPEPKDSAADQKKNLKLEEEAEEGPQQGQPEPHRQDVFDTANSNWWDGGQKVKAGETFQPRKLNTPLDKLARRHAGRRSLTKTERKHGRYIRARPAGNKTDDIAFDATFRAAAPYQKRRQEKRKRLAFVIERGDLQRKVRVKKVANLVLFLVDASWSMAVAERMNATKGAILSLLTDAYQRRDRVGLIVFQKDRATLVLPPTNSVQLAQKALVDIPVGGKTPLSAGLLLAQDVLKHEKFIHPDVEPLLIVLTDGAGNVSIGSLPPQEESYKFAELIAHEQVRSVVINMEHAAFDQGLAQALANHLKAPCYSLSELKAENLYHAVRQEMASGTGKS